MSWIVTVHQEFDSEEEARTWADSHELGEVAVVQEHVPYSPPESGTIVEEEEV